MDPSGRRSVTDFAIQGRGLFAAAAGSRAKVLDRLRLGDAVFRQLTRAAALGVLILLSAVIWPLLQRSQVLVLLATLGLSLILQQLATNILGGDTKLVPPPLGIPVPIGPILYPAYDLVVIAVGMGILVLGYFALRYTRYGIWLRAVAQSIAGVVI